jgi:hypothetical protein
LGPGKRARRLTRIHVERLRVHRVAYLGPYSLAESTRKPDSECRGRRASQRSGPVTSSSRPVPASDCARPGSESAREPDSESDHDSRCQNHGARAGPGPPSHHDHGTTGSTPGPSPAAAPSCALNSVTVVTSHESESTEGGQFYRDRSQCQPVT